nr:DExH-box ATP-dependent RNA helicase DExH11 [Tanacetum cinerariifolium]
DASELEIEVIDAESLKSIHLEAENKSDLPIGAHDSESFVIDQILSTRLGGLTLRASLMLFLGMGDFGLQVWAITRGSDGIADHFNDLVPDLALGFPLN